MWKRKGFTLPGDGGRGCGCLRAWDGGRGTGREADRVIIPWMPRHSKAAPDGNRGGWEGGLLELNVRAEDEAHGEGLDSLGLFRLSHSTKVSRGEGHTLNNKGILFRGEFQNVHGGLLSALVTSGAGHITFNPSYA